jgi:hypothetical protein
MGEAVGALLIIALFGVLWWLMGRLAVAVDRARAVEPHRTDLSGAIVGCVFVLLLWGWAIPFLAPFLPLILLWWSWSAVNNRLKASTPVGALLWAGFLLAASLILIPTTLCLVLLAIYQPEVGLLFLAIALALVVGMAVLVIRRQLASFALAVALLATVAFPLLVVFVIVIYEFLSAPVDF